MHGARYSHCHLIPTLCSQQELLKPVCNNFLQSNRRIGTPPLTMWTHWVFQYVFNFDNLTVILSSFGFHDTRLSSVCSLVNLPYQVSSCRFTGESGFYFLPSLSMRHLDESINSATILMWLIRSYVDLCTSSLPLPTQSKICFCVNIEVVSPTHITKTLVLTPSAEALSVTLSHNVY